MATRTISQRELRNDSAKIIRELQEGHSFILTNHGVPVAEIRPFHGPQPIVGRDVRAAAAADWQPIDAEAFMRDVDEAVDQAIVDPYTGESI